MMSKATKSLEQATHELTVHHERLSHTMTVRITKEDDSVSWDQKTFVVHGIYTAIANLDNTLEAIAWEMHKIKLSETYDPREQFVPGDFRSNYITYYEVLKALTNDDVMAAFGNLYGLGLVVEQEPRPDYSWRYFAPALRIDREDDDYLPDPF